MKRKLLMLTLAGTLVFSSSSIAMAADVQTDDSAIEAEVTAEETEAPVEEEAPAEETAPVEEKAVKAAPEYNFVTGTETVKAIGREDVAIIDVRSTVNYEKSHIKGSVSIPVFDQDNNLPDSLASAFTAYVNSHKADFAGKKLYLLCNSGSRGAQKATALLIGCGFDNSTLFTVEGGAKGDVVSKYLNQYTSGQTVVDAIYNGGENFVVIDVRNAGLYAKSHLRGSVSIPVFDASNNLPDNLANEFKSYITANKTDFEGKTLYLLCNSGSRGAEKATDLLRELGFDNKNIFTIKGGAKENPVKAHLFQFVTGEQTVAAIDNENTVILDLRAYDAYSQGHVPGAAWSPVFPLDDAALDTQIKNYAAHELIPSGKNVYVLCYSGFKCARRATLDLVAAGMNPDKIFTIENGANNEVVSAKFVTDVNSRTVTDKEAINAIGNNDILILDVRAAEKYEAGHLKGSLSLPVFVVKDGQNAIDDTLLTELDKYVKAHREEFLKPVYILCNSGSRGAQNATRILAENNLSNAYTIVGGATSELIQSKFVKDETETPDPGVKPNPDPKPDPETKPEPEVKPDPKPETKPEVKPEVKPEQKPASTTPSTGDTATAAPYALMMGAAIAAIIGRKKFK